jgi:hypothetical protein
MRKLATLVVLATLSGCVVSTRYFTAMARLAEAPTCGGGLAAVAVGIDGAIATGLVLANDELSDFDQVALGALAADVFVGGIMAIQDCTTD